MIYVASIRLCAQRTISKARQTNSCNQVVERSATTYANTNGTKDSMKTVTLPTQIIVTPVSVFKTLYLILCSTFNGFRLDVVLFMLM